MWFDNQIAMEEAVASTICRTCSSVGALRKGPPPSSMATRPRLALAPSTKWRKPARPRHCCRTATSLAVKFSISKTTPTHTLAGICCTARFMKISDITVREKAANCYQVEALSEGGAEAHGVLGWHMEPLRGPTPEVFQCDEAAVDVQQLNCLPFGRRTLREAKKGAPTHWRSAIPGKNEAHAWVETCTWVQQKMTSLQMIPTVTSYSYIFVTNSDILCAKIWRGRGGENNSDEI